MKAEPVSAEGARPAIGAKARMLRLLMREALVLLSDGQIPAVAESPPVPACARHRLPLLSEPQ